MAAVDAETVTGPGLAERIALVRDQLAPIRSRRALVDSYRRESLCRLATTGHASDSAAEVLDLAYALRWAELQAEPDQFGDMAPDWDPADG
jgi:hypothetical protein